MIKSILVGVIVLLAVIYIVRAINQTLRGKGGCSGCGNLFGSSGSCPYEDSQKPRKFIESHPKEPPTDEKK